MASQKETMRVTAPLLDLASSPGGEVVSQVLGGDVVRPLGPQRDGLVEVESRFGEASDDRERGWCEAAGLGVQLDGAALGGVAPDNASLWRVASVEALAYARPTRRAGAPVERLPLGAAFGLSESADREEKGFVCLTVRGAPRWVQAQDLTRRPPAAPSVADRLAVAHSLLGRPYVWGGCTTLGADCSGLVLLLARLAGVGLPHSAAGQARRETARFVAVGEASVAPGDFLYLAGSDGRVDHVVVAAEDASVIHASAEGGRPAVRREPWATVRTRGSLAAVRRVVDSPEAPA